MLQEVEEASCRPLSGRFIAYYRVSTDKQGQSVGLEAQRKAVMDYLNGGAWELVAEFTEVESGKRADRPELEKALEACRRHKARLVIAKLDRLSRNVAFIATVMELWSLSPWTTLTPTNSPSTFWPPWLSTSGK